MGKFLFDWKWGFRFYLTILKEVGVIEFEKSIVISPNKPTDEEKGLSWSGN